MSADFSKVEDVAWLQPRDGLAAAKVEVVAWLEGASTSFDTSKVELVAWLDSATNRRRMSLM